VREFAFGIPNYWLNLVNDLNGGFSIPVVVELNI